MLLNIIGKIAIANVKAIAILYKWRRTIWGMHQDQVSIRNQGPPASTHRNKTLEVPP